MTEEAKLERTDHGSVPQGPGWFVLNVKDAAWAKSDHFGEFTTFEGPHRFEQIGLNVHVIHPGQPNCHYHRENFQENFLVLEGECTLLVEEQERPCKRWDFIHCPPETNHVFVGAGDGPCVLLMLGSRVGEERLTYPASPLAQRHGAGIGVETTDPKVSYEGKRGRTPIPAPWPRA